MEIGIYYGPNPWALGIGDYQDLLGTDDEPALMIHTPDIERYADTESEAKACIDRWIEEFGCPEAFRLESDIRIGWILDPRSRPKLV